MIFVWIFWEKNGRCSVYYILKKKLRIADCTKPQTCLLICYNSLDVATTYCVYISTRVCSGLFIDARPRSVPTIDMAHIALSYSIFQFPFRPANKLSCFARTSCCNTVSVDQVPLVSLTIPRASSQSVISALITTLRKPSLHPFSVFSQERSWSRKQKTNLTQSYTIPCAHLIRRQRQVLP